MNEQEQLEFIEELRQHKDAVIYQYDAKRLLMEAGLDEEVAYHLAARLICGTKTLMIQEVKKHITTLLHFIETA